MRDFFYEMSLVEYQLHLLDVYPETIVDGEGLRYAFYLAGCLHACPHCHNPQSWDPNRGELLTDELLEEHIRSIRENTLLNGVTITGGDPFYNPEGLLALLKILKSSLNANIWCYTGYTLEKLAATPRLLAPLEYIDVLVDGPFIQEIRTEDLRNEMLGGAMLEFRGSSNQRIITNPYAEALSLQIRRKE